jgi:prepilin-type N-terminal cleavage/methylation domain-containing protein
MLTTMRRRLRGRAGTGRDTGFTLVEYTVSMAIFTVVIAITAGGIALMSRDVVKTTNLSTSTDQIRLAFTRLDRQVRYASQVNFPGVNTAGTSWYVEFLAPDGDGDPTCHQWRLDTTTDLLQQRSWAGPPTAAPTTAPAWTTVAVNIANSPTADPPFTFIQANTGIPFQGIRVKLIGKRVSANTSAVTLETSMSARNTSVMSDSNEDANDDGVSDTPVCQGVARP